MGQYYQLLNIDKKERVDPSQYGHGSKMVEHSWCGNSFLYEVLHLLANDWKGDRLFHCGDYAIDDIPEKYLVKYTDHRGSVLTYEDTRGFTELEEHWLDKMDGMWNEFDERYVLVNYDKAVYCEINCCPLNSHDMRICPLPLLLSNSSVIAGGDYHSYASYEFLRSWSYNRVGLEPRDSEMLDMMRKMEYTFYN